jgi:Histidine kinase
MFVFITEAMSMESWRLANSNEDILAPGLRALEYALLLPPLLVAVRAAVAIGYRPPAAAGRIAAQILLCVLFSILAHPAQAYVTWLHDPGSLQQPGGIRDALLHPTRLSAAAWLASAWAQAMNYVLVVGIVAGVKTYRDLAGERILRAEVQRQATQARLQALTNQLNPHFLFNALNTIVALIGTEPKLAQTMVSRMSELLRRILSEGATQFVSLRRELELLEHYLDIQELRFPKRLSHEFRFDAQAAGALLPSLILQPLIENAVVHGLRDESLRVHVLVAAQVADGFLKVTITNPTAEPAGESSQPRPGVGLRNVSERLDTLFGGRASLHLSAYPPGQVRVDLTIPQATAPAQAPIRAATETNRSVRV